jgi:hypothetical protein
MPAKWQITYWPRCEAHAFLSHCAEDRDHLVEPVFWELERRGVIPWLDRYHYPSGRDGFESLREQLLKCRHVVYFLTPAMLRQGRGWASAERAFATTIQQHLSYGGEVAHIELPLLFVPGDDSIFQRSIWRSLIDKEPRPCPHVTPHTKRPQRSGEISYRGGGWRKKHIQWAADAIEDFIRQEEEWAIELGIRLGQDTTLRNEFARDRNLSERLLAQSPRLTRPT